MTTVSDAGVPALAVLLGEGHRAVLDAFAAASGASIGSARVGQVRYSPGRSVTVQYEVEVQTGDTSRSGTVVAVSGADVPGDVLRLASDDVEVALWAYPHDPHLPGLPAAADPASAADLLAQLGAGRSSADLRRRAYRAGRRAVIEIRGSSGSVFVKVIRPSRVAALQELHTTMAAHLPVPHSLGWSADQGIVALQALPGRTLRKAVADGRALPGPERILALLDRIPPVTRRAAPGPAQRVGDHGRLLRSIMPGSAERLDRIEAAVAGLPDEPLVPVHGDFHASQILVDEATITGLVDVDTAGMGRRSDDLAGLLAQLSVLAQMTPHGRSFESYGASLIAAFDAVVDPRALRVRVGAAVVGFATGPFRVQMGDWRGETERRVLLAEQWVGSAAAAS